MQQETVQGKGTIWYYEPGANNRRRKCIYNHCKKLIYEVLYRGITTHSMRDIYFLMRLLPRSTVIDTYALFRYIMILISSAGTRRINKNFILYLETSLIRYDLSKPDVFIEFLSYFIKNNRIEDARELYNLRHRYMSYATHRKVPHNDTNIACYGLLMNYLEWQQRAPNQDGARTFDVSLQGWLVNGMDPLKQVEHNYELFVMCIARVLTFYGLHKKVYLLLSEFQRNNPDNIAAQLLLFKLIRKFSSSDSGNKRRRTATDQSDEMDIDDDEDAQIEHRSTELASLNNFSVNGESGPFELDMYPISSDNKNILSNLIRLDPRRVEILELSETCHDSKIETIQVIMDSLMEVPLMRDTNRWRCLQKLVDEVISSDDSTQINDLAELWQTRYQRYWRLADFLRLARESVESPMRASDANVIKRVIKSLKLNFDLDVSGGLEDDGEDGPEPSYPDF